MGASPASHAAHAAPVASRRGASDTVGCWLFRRTRPTARSSLHLRLEETRVARAEVESASEIGGDEGYSARAESNPCAVTRGVLDNKFMSPSWLWACGGTSAGRPAGLSVPCPSSGFLK
ncbi:hypothetical protein THAOC_14929 [Thalassiosira oceanica]|uniref:Uncharacterized protein n=1 Tax=Thalassiosira oceanica TaxID=159749 RepID=K0SE09_THAOC|nr:hypothetical protein THAOC_14929 [Thalassiosira oceanica]|eukprot:EJK64348.1 hypothetical protein THAOC_14929 [Thalassiosira oceanica]